MNLSYASDLFVAALTVIIITSIAWRRRAVPGGGSLAAMGTAMTVWMIAYGFYWLFSETQARLISFNLMYTGVVVVPVTFLLFALSISNQVQRLKKRNLAILFIIPALTLVMIWTDPYHGFFYGDGTPDTLISSAGAWFWINLVYSYLIIVFALALLVQAWYSTGQPLRAQLSAILWGALAPILLNIAMLAKFHSLAGLDLTPFGFVISCICIALALSRYRLLDLIPIARSVILDQMTDGFLTMDTHDRIVDVNPMAQKMLGDSSDKIIGMPAEIVFKSFPDLYQQFRHTLTLSQEISLETDPPTYLDLRITPLYDRRDKFSGRLIVVRDVTDRKLVEKAENEQRVLAEALRDSAAALNQSRSFEDVLDQILDNVGRVVPYDLATILMADDIHTAHLVRDRGYRENGLEECLHRLTFSMDNFPNLRRMIETGASVVITDTSKDPSWNQIEGLEKFRSYVGSPIQIRKIVVGFLNLGSTTPGFFGQVHADRLQAFVDQAAIAIENARLLEDAQKRAEELSVLQEIGLAATSGLEMDKVLVGLLEKCKQVLPIEAFYVATYDNKSGLVAYPLFYDQGETIILPAHDVRESPGLTGYVIQTRQVLNLPDVFQDDVSKKFNIVHIGGDPTRSYVGVPLWVGDEVVGVISMQSSQPDAYHPAQVHLLETIATLAAGAIENARLFEEVRLHAEEMTVLFDIGITVTSGLDMGQVLRTLLEKCRQVLPVEAFYTAILDPDTGMIHHPLAYDLGEYPQIPTRDINKNPGLSGHIINTRRTLYIPDMLSPDAIKTFQIFRTTGTPTRAFVGVPMIVSDRIVGVISMQSYKPDAYNPDQIRLLETIATQAAVAIENSRLYANAQQEILEREKAEHRYRALFEQSHDAVFIIGFDGKHLEANQRATEMLGYSTEELCSLYVRDISAEPEDSDTTIRRLIAGEHIPLYERKFRKKSGDVIVVEINVELVRDADGKPIHIQSVVRDISERKESEQALQNVNEKMRLQLSEIYVLQSKLREQAIRDPLTGLFNRRYLEEALVREFSLAERQGSKVCLVMMDIDGFKEFNDNYGHDAGDYLLKKLGDMLRKEIRRSDFPCRFGGEEFLVVMPGVSLEKGHERAERLRKLFINGKFRYMGMKLNATISLGVAIFPDHGKTWEEVLHTADRAMYAAKAAGRNMVRSAGV